MTRALLFLPVLCGACLVVPATQTTTRAVGTDTGDATFAKAREVVLTAEMREQSVHVQAKRIGECTQPVFAMHEVVTSKRMRMGGASDPRARALGALLAPVTLPVSALISAIAVAADTPTTSTSTTPIGTKRFACSLEANQLVVRIVLPSGSIVERTTDRWGRVVVLVPDSEPYEGALTVTAPTAAELRVAYALPKPAITAARDAVVTCASQHGVHGDVTAKLSINERGRAVRFWASRGDAAFNACVAKELGSLTFPETARSGTLKLPFELPATARL